MQFADYVIDQIEKHPSMEPQDAVKLCYQAAFGAEHLLLDEDAAKAYLEKEYASVEVSETESLFEKISDDVCRINLRAWKYRKLPLEWLFRMFVCSAGREKAEKSRESEKQNTEAKEQETGRPNDNWQNTRQMIFRDYLNTVGQLSAQGAAPFTTAQWTEYRKVYEANGMGAVHHSEKYRRQEKPAYRIISAKFLSIVPMLEKIAESIPAQAECGSISAAAEKSITEIDSERTAPYILAIEGRAASGKSTLAKKLGMVLDAPVIAMDDFFLPFDMRNNKRLEEPGGNIHYERFLEEVLPYLKQPEGFAYRRFDCGKGDYDGKVTIVSTEKSRFRIVEGSYSLHPKFGSYADLTIFLDIDPKTQMKRILVRNGAEMAKNFHGKWIPMEEIYLSAYQIASQADLIAHELNL